MSINEQDLPGIGRRFEIAARKGQRVVLVVHDSGQRNLYLMDRDADEPTCGVELSDDQARHIGSILGGTLFKPAVDAEIEALVGELLVERVVVSRDAAAVGRPVAALEIGRRTGFSVIAIVRGKTVLKGTDPQDVLQPDDRLVVVGRSSELPKLIGLLEGESP